MPACSAARRLAGSGPSTRGPRAAARSRRLARATGEIGAMTMNRAPEISKGTPSYPLGARGVFTAGAVSQLGPGAYRWPPGDGPTDASPSKGRRIRQRAEGNTSLCQILYSTRRPLERRVRRQYRPVR